MHADALPPLVAEALDRFAKRVRARFGSRVAEITLYGSYARGSASEDSDVDVLVVIDDLRDTEELEIADIASSVKLESSEWVGLAPLSLSTARAQDLRGRGRLLFREIAREGVPL